MGEGDGVARGGSGGVGPGPGNAGRPARAREGDVLPGEGDSALRYTPFSPRLVRSDAPVESCGHRLKVYHVSHRSIAFDAARFAELPRLLPSALPRQGARESGRPGVGFIILHQSLTCDYIVLAWWDRENELPIRVWVRDAGEWRWARDGESVCVWDLEVIWHERNLWVETALSGQPLVSALEEYLSRRFGSVSVS